MGRVTPGKGRPAPPDGPPYPTGRDRRPGRADIDGRGRTWSKRGPGRAGAGRRRGASRGGALDPWRGRTRSKRGTGRARSGSEMAARRESGESGAPGGGTGAL